MEEKKINQKFDQDNISVPTAPTEEECMPQDLATATEMIRRMRKSITVLGQRCLSLEQGLQKYQLEAEEDVLDTNCRLRNILHITVYYETEQGYDEQHKITRSAILDQAGHGALHLQLPENAASIRLDPDDFPCTVRDLTVSRPGVEMAPVNGIGAGENGFIFTKRDPGIIIKSAQLFSANEEFDISFAYERLMDGPLLSAVSALQVDVVRQQQELVKLNQSTSWRLTAPVRAVKRFLMKLSGK